MAPVRRSEATKRGCQIEVQDESGAAVPVAGDFLAHHDAEQEPSTASVLSKRSGDPNYGERISTGFVESAVNQVVSKRFSKKQSMRWTQAGAHLALQARARVLDGELEDAFRRRWPGFQPLPKAEPDEAGHGSFASPTLPSSVSLVALDLRYAPIMGDSEFLQATISRSRHD